MNFALEKGFLVFKKGLELIVSAARIAAAWFGAFAVYAAIGLLVVGIIALFGVFIYIMRDQIVAVIGKILDFFVKIFDFITSALNIIVNGILVVINSVGNIINSVISGIASIVKSIGGFFKDLFTFISGTILSIANSIFGNIFGKKETKNESMTNYESMVIDHLDSILSCLTPITTKEAIVKENKEINVSPINNVNLNSKNQTPINNIQVSTGNSLEVSTIATGVLHIENYLKTIASDKSIVKLESQKVIPFLAPVKSNETIANTYSTKNEVNTIHQGMTQLGSDNNSVLDILKEANKISLKILSKLDTIGQNKKLSFPTLNMV